MKRLVVDTSVVIASITNEPMRGFVLDATEGVEVLLAPLSVHWEIGNAFSAMLKRDRITLEQALEALELYQSIPIQFVDVALEDAVRLAWELQIYAYDAYLIQCALDYHAPLLALDGGLRAAASKMKIEVLEVP